MRFAMVVMSLGALGAAWDISPLWQALVAALGFSATPHQPEPPTMPDPCPELTHRLRHPVQDALAHPVVTLKRKVDRRRA